MKFDLEHLLNDAGIIYKKREYDHSLKKYGKSLLTKKKSMFQIVLNLLLNINYLN